jgi:hypothetical protein
MLFKHTNQQKSEIENMVYWEFEILIVNLKKDLEKRVDSVNNAKEGGRSVMKNEKFKLDVF